MDIVIKNLRFAARSLRRNPGFTAVALLTLALGIGANVAIFSVVRTVVLSPLPYPAADRVVQVWPETPVSLEQMVAFEEVEAFSALSAVMARTLSLTGTGRPEQLIASEVAPAHFAVTGIEPALGRAFRPEERQPGRDGVVVLSHQLWQRRFGGDASFVGGSVTLDGRVRLVIGVMPEGYKPVVSQSDVWVPLVVDPASELYRDWAGYELFARLRAQATVLGAQAEVRGVITRLHEKHPGYVRPDADQTATVSPFLTQLVGDVRPRLVILFGAVGLVLLIACSNVASLVLARSSVRQREIAIRGALGAGRRSLVSQLLTESLLLALMGGLLGIMVASWAVAALAGRLASSMPRAEEIGIDGLVLAFAVLVSLFAGLLFGLAPALRATRGDVQSTLKGSNRGLTRSHGVHHALVTAEIALSVTLVIGAGLLVKSFWRVQGEDLGFDPEGLLTLQVQPPSTQYDNDAKRRIYFESVRARLAAVAGVESAAGIHMLPMTPTDVKLLVMRADQRVPKGERPPWTSVRMVTPGLMATLGVPLLRGRQLASSDTTESLAVGLVNQTLARKLWGDEDPVGRELLYDDESPFFTVVGVVGDLRQHRLDQASSPQAYVSIGQQAWNNSMSYVLRTSPVSGMSGSLFAAVREAVWSVDGQVPIIRMAMMEDIVHGSLTDKRQLTGLFSIFAGLALVLGAVGVYGVTAYTVSQRLHETGVRMALGATGGAVVRDSLGRVVLPVARGLVLGLVASAGLTRLLSGLLYQVEATDPVVFVAVTLVLAVSAGLAAFLPARRAARVDPMVILGSD